ncbi:unnamed protein product [Bursaphelenchus okinawaensis]|uniref:Uncharacterized protein n=1 Tax=Bursaphelenchus okinawaensis TaxID=465554 RepID=A0A811K713_9BILA|nr:unnamed protein product [Bursaphelenchus okinawaensis]CAG9094540.1 unnamed protein product [Bursaphelenchus okinawaensis]
MDWMWSWKDYVFYGMCSCSGTSGVDTEPVPKNKRIDWNHALEHNTDRPLWCAKRSFCGDSSTVEEVEMPTSPVQRQISAKKLLKTEEEVDDDGIRVIMRRPSRYTKRSAKEVIVDGMRRLSRRTSAHCDLYSVQSYAQDWSQTPSFFSMSPQGTPVAQPRLYKDQKSAEFLNFLEHMQSQRLDDQRCEMPDMRYRNNSDDKSHNWGFLVYVNELQQVITGLRRDPSSLL